MTEMSLTAEHLIVIGRGKLIADTSVADFLAGASKKLVHVRTPQEAALREIVSGFGGTVTEPEAGLLEVSGLTAEQIGEAAAAQRIVLHELTPHQASLEEAFMDLTRGELEFAATGEEAA
jgi:ABC-2 type transport system ATP-binding protein